MDNNKRVFLAVALSLLVLLTWNYFFPPVTPLVTDNQTDTIINQTEPSAAPVVASPVPGAAETPTAQFSPAGETLTIDTPLYAATINSAGGILQSFVLKNYKESIAPDARNIDLVTAQSVSKAPLGLIWNAVPTWAQGQWSVQGSDLTLADGQSGSIELTGEVGGVRVARTLTFTGGSYEIKDDVKITNTTPAQIQGNLAFSVSSSNLAAEGDRYNLTKIAYMAADKLTTEDSQKDLGLGLESAGPAQWGGIESNYFLIGLVPTSADMIIRAKLEDTVYRLTMTDQILLDPGITQLRTASYYLGPKTESYLTALPKNLKGSINYGFFDLIAKPLNTFLKFLYTYVHNYGVAIIILTIIIKILFWPLSHKSYKSMEQMKKLQPMMGKIREKYADDREKMNAEIMQLYKTYKVNPAGGCIPMLLQIPVFFALYQALMGAIELRHAAFIPTLPFTDLVWLADLSAKDPYYITPLIMGATMFLQQRMSPPAGDPMQAKIMMFMPVIFTFLFLNFPSGLVVYWLVNNVLSIAQQWMMIRRSK
ncbi:MAG: membrane protein insertase YidC [Desulfovibrionales bacterium]|nr:membrane protein insertase YidC [Desulfovibrionales bacterium]